MKKLVFAFIFLSSVNCQAAEFYLAFHQADFLKGYTESIHVGNGNALAVRNDNLNKEKANAKDMFPSWKQVTLSDSKILQFKEELASLGVETWKPMYPENTKGLICDGFTFYLVVTSEDLNVDTEGHCTAPEKFTEVQNLVHNLVWKG